MEDTTQEYFLKQQASKLELVKNIAENLVGNDALIDGPFKSHKQTYADYAASGKAVKFIEDYITSEVLPIYSNTHTSSSYVGIQTSCFREEARGIIRDTYHCTDNDVIIFTGNGCTSAVNTFVRILGLERKSTPLGVSKPLLECKFPGCPLCFNDPGDLRLHQRTHTDGDASSWTTDVSSSTGRTVQPIQDNSTRPIVFVGPFEHHSNLLPWREADVDLIQIKINSQGMIDLNELQKNLQQYKNRPLRIVSLNHVSNVTGVITPMSAINELVHREGGLVCWDCATACSHEAPLMNNTSVNSYDYCDALFFSPHKMVGGVGSPGLLILKKKLLLNDVPNLPGGGTVFYVNDDLHRYTQVLTEREEGGTPNIIGAIRLGLVLHLHNEVGWDWIQQREAYLYQQTIERLKEYPNIVILGKDDMNEKEAVFSFMIKFHGRFLHWNFVSMLLSDLFGIQTRSGCMCAGPYSMRLLGIHASKAKQLDQLLLNKEEIFRPGYTRVSLSYVMTDEEVKFIQDALIFISQYGWLLLPNYIFYEDTGEWRHKTIKNKKPFRRWLNDICFSNGKMEYQSKAHELQPFSLDSSSLTSLFNQYLDEAKQIVDETIQEMSQPSYTVSEYTANRVKNEESSLLTSSRWYVTRKEAFEDFKNHYQVSRDEQLLPSCFLQPNSNQQSLITEPASVKRIENPTPLPSASQSKIAANPFTLKLQNKVIKKESCMVSDSGREVMPISVVKMAQEPGVEFKYRTGVDGQLEYTAIVPGMSFKEHVKYMKKNKDLFPQIPTRLMKLMGQAIGHYDMLHEGDRVMLGLSGGKDSLTMLHCLLQLQRKSPKKFEIACVTVDPQTTGFDPSPLRDYCKKLGVQYFYESQAVIALAKKKLKNGSICSWCSRMKRVILYSTMRREGYNVLVLAQHLDDLAESFLMSVFHNGILRTMKACYMNKEQDIRIIRPFVYVREKQLREFAKTMNLPIIDENCPACFEGPKERYRMKTLLAAEENLFPNVYNCLLSAMIPLMKYNSAVGCALERETPREMRGKLRFLKDNETGDKGMEEEGDEDDPFGEEDM